MTGGAIKVDKRLPLFFGGRAGVIESDRLLIPSLAGVPVHKIIRFYQIARNKGEREYILICLFLFIEVKNRQDPFSIGQYFVKFPYRYYVGKP